MESAGCSWVSLKEKHIASMCSARLNSGKPPAALQELSGLAMCLARRGRKRGGTAER